MPKPIEGMDDRGWHLFQNRCRVVAYRRRRSGSQDGRDLNWLVQYVMLQHPSLHRGSGDEATPKEVSPELMKGLRQAAKRAVIDGQKHADRVAGKQTMKTPAGAPTDGQD